MRTVTMLLVLITSSLGPIFFKGVEAAASGAQGLSSVQRLNLEPINAKRSPPEEPEIKTWFELGSIVLKILVVNPDPTESQTVPVKIYLPKEVSPKDIIDLGDLKLDYDPDTGVYSVYTEVNLGPGQSMTKMVEMEDIWLFTEEELSSFVNQAKEMASGLGGTPHAVEAAVLVRGIEQKIQEILKRQEETATEPAEHIQAYRQGITMLTTIEQDLSALERLMQVASERQGEEKSPLDRGDSDSRIALLGPSGVPEGGSPLGRSISMTTAWRMIFAVLAFLGVLSFIFFMTWHRVLRVTMESEQQAVPLSVGGREEKGAENEVTGPQLE